MCTTRATQQRGTLEINNGQGHKTEMFKTYTSYTILHKGNEKDYEMRLSSKKIHCYHKSYCNEQ